MASQHNYYVYMVAGYMGALYTGMTRDIQARIDHHQNGLGNGFSAKYQTTKLVWCEITDSLETAREREAQIKRWRRSKKAYLIELENPYWEDISTRVI